jgi:hypothetical protein
MAAAVPAARDPVDGRLCRKADRPRSKLKEINHALLLGRRSMHPADLKPLVDGFAEATVAP